MWAPAARYPATDTHKKTEAEFDVRAMISNSFTPREPRHVPIVSARERRRGITQNIAAATATAAAAAAAAAAAECSEIVTSQQAGNNECVLRDELLLRCC